MDILQDSGIMSNVSFVYFKGPDGTVSLETFIESHGSLEDYCETMAKRGTWADHVVVINMAKLLERDIMIVTSTPSTSGDDCLTWVVGDTTGKAAPLLIGHEWENHYRSLEPIERICPVPEEKQHLHLSETLPNEDPDCDDHTIPLNEPASSARVERQATDECYEEWLKEKIGLYCYI